MKSVGVAVVVVLMALRAVTTREAPIQTTPETPFQTTTKTPAIDCPTISDCEGPYCSVKYDTDGCLYCLCGDPICVSERCPPGQRCVMIKEDPYYSCVSDGSYTTSTTPTVPTTIECPVYTCAGQCDYFTDTDGCSKCACVPFTSTSMATPSTTPQILCYYPTCAGDCRYGVDSNGCYTCECVPFTSTTSTTPTTSPPITCFHHTCFGDCRYGVDSDGCYTCQCVPFTTTSSSPPTSWCPMVTCFRGCRYVIDSNGCPGCDCPSPSCEGTTCAVGERCELVATTCYPWENTCYPQPVCVPDGTTTPCPTVTCATGCELDNFARPCPTCACPPTCEGFYCEDGYECRLVDVNCFRAPCFPQPECQPVTGTTTSCPTVTCATGCELDYFTRPCPTCACPPTCEGFYCKDGYECQLIVIYCKRAPCFPRPECRPIADPCTGSPNKGRCGGAINRWTYNSLTNTCEKFVYYGCTPSPNTFSSRKACKNRCKPACAAVVCEPDCYTFTRKNKCTKCICPNPCEGLRCRAGFECKMRETKCGTKAEPYCARV